MLTTLLTAPLAWPFAPLAPLFAGGDDGVPPVEVIDGALAGRAGVRFVATRPRPGRRRRGAAPVDPAAYDAAIVERGEVPTRPGNAHDFANALVWATFPRTKRAHHARQLGVVRAAALPGRAWSRSEEGDALAMLDEGGILVVVPAAEVADAERDLIAGDDAAIAARVAAGRALGVVFGHSIVEHLGRGEAPPVAGLALAIAGDPSDPDLEALDRGLAAHVASPATFRSRRGHGIASAHADVLGPRGARR